MNKQGLSYIILCPFRILYNSKFILMAASLGSLGNAVVVTRFQRKNAGKLQIYVICTRNK